MSENYIVSARKYRPASFSTVVGQQALTHTLKTAIANQKLAHAYLFCGPRGVGKTTCARIFAKAINCEHLTADGEPCNECESCKAFNEQRSYNIVELDAASNNSVDDIRTIVEQVRIPPQVGRYRVFIIDEVHMLTTSAFNAFLKTLEEPPEYAIFILATTEKQKIIPTILSRCQIYDFARIKVPDIVEQLKYICTDRGVTAEVAALNVIAQKADGAMRDALSIFDQVSASCEGNITYQGAIDNLNVLDHDYYFRLDEAFLKSDIPAALLIYKEIRERGFDSQFFINGLAQHFRDLMVASNPQTVVLLEMNDEVSQRFIQQAQKFAPAYFYRVMDLCNYCDLNYRDASNKQFLVELTLIKICQLLTGPMPPAGGDQPGVKKMQAAPQATAAPQAAQAPTAAPHAQAPAAPAASAPAPAASTSTPIAPAPAPTVAQGPAVQPRPQTNTAPASGIKVPSIYINNPARAAEQAAAQQATAAKKAPAAPTFSENKPIDPEQFAQAWRNYPKTHPQDIIVTNAMNRAVPTLVSGTHYKMMSANEGEEGFVKNRLTDILTYLRTELQNSTITLEIELDKTIKTQKIMTEREIVNDILSRRPEFSDFIKEFQLTLS
ncbi:MAG: DNA polymerase III subunit gamma/tau [Bacteroidales bacterium]|nr:DNA polymerase III subunit gamma/tau [Bacteroidales bacterium]